MKRNSLRPGTNVSWMQIRHLSLQRSENTAQQFWRTIQDASFHLLPILYPHSLKETMTNCYLHSRWDMRLGITFFFSTRIDIPGKDRLIHIHSHFSFHLMRQTSSNANPSRLYEYNYVDFPHNNSFRITLNPRNCTFSTLITVLGVIAVIQSFCTSSSLSLH